MMFQRRSASHAAPTLCLALAIAVLTLPACQSDPPAEPTPIIEPVGYDYDSPSGSVPVPDTPPPADTPALTDLAGNVHHPLHHDGSHPLTTLIFITADCPVSNGSAPAIQRLADQFADRGVRFFLVHVDRDVDQARASEHRDAFGYDDAPVTILLDHDHELVQAVDATVTPEAAVLDANGELIYRGRINNEWEDFGVRRVEATRHELRDALAAALDGEPAPEPRTEAVGCFIPEYP